MIWDLIGWLMVVGWVWKLWPVWWQLLRPRPLMAVPLMEGASWPLVSIIVPARDEGASVEAALRRMLALDYPNFEVVAIDDRSRDATRSIMDRMAQADSRCFVIHISELPAGWLGKNHANAVGAQRARGEFLLFTDGDVMFEPDVLRRAMTAVQRDGLGHLTLLPDAIIDTFGEAVLMNYFTLQFTIMTQMPLVRYRWAKEACVGIGAFNLVRRSAYESIGGHSPLRMEVADDMMLGKLIKDGGFQSDVYGAAPLVRVRWQHGVSGIVRGLEKNAFAGVRYSVPLVLLVTVLSIVLNVLPPVLMLTGPARWPATVFVGLSVLTNVGLAMRNRFSPLAGLLYPLAGLVFTYIVIRSMVLTLRRGGVVWRDSFYPLAELRAGMIKWWPL